MDDLSNKRIERDVDKFNEAGKKMIASVQQHADQIGSMDLASLKAEYERRAPGWAADLTTMPITMLTFCMSRLAAIGAPREYLMQLLVAALDESAVRSWPAPSAERPTWVIEPGELAECTCGLDHPGGARDMAAQVIRILLLAYAELVEVVHGDAIIRGEFRTYASEMSADELDAETKLIRERALDLVGFILQTFGGVLPSEI